MTKGKIKAMQKAVLGMLLWVAASTAEAKPILRHVEGLKGLEINLGIQAMAPFAEINGMLHITRNWLVKIGLGGAKSLKQRGGEYKAIFSQPGVGYTLLDNSRNLFLSALIGPYIVYEQLNKEQQFNIALALGGELAFFLLHRLEVVGSGGMRYFFRDSKAGSLGYFLGAGLRFTL